MNYKQPPIAAKSAIANMAARCINFRSLDVLQMSVGPAGDKLIKGELKLTPFLLSRFETQEG